MNGSCIVVTGGAGFIGSTLVRELADKNHVIVVDDLSTGHLNNIQDMIDTDVIPILIDVRGKFSYNDEKLTEFIYRKL